MKIDFSFDFFRGVRQIKSTPKCTFPSRMTDGLLNFYREPEHDRLRAWCPSNISIAFETDSPFFKMKIFYGEPARPKYDAVAFVNGKRILFSPLPRADFLDIELNLSGKSDIEILLPPLVECFLNGGEIADGSNIVPRPRKSTWLFAGDSITQGMTVSAPDRTWVRMLSKRYGKQASNLSVAGVTMAPEVGRASLDYDKEVFFIAYGVNDFSVNKPLEKFRSDTSGMLEYAVRSTSKIVLMTPIVFPRKDRNDIGLHLEDYREILREEAGRYPRIRIVEGLNLVPSDLRYFADDVHPNDEGSILFERNLASELGDFLK